MKNSATKENRDAQLRAFFANLPRDSKGRLTPAGRDARDGWLRQEGISAERARQILKGESSKPRPFNADHAARCIEYLRKNGYTVTPPAWAPDT